MKQPIMVTTEKSDTRIVAHSAGHSVDQISQSRAVVVLGMHRSGTSAVAGALNILGVYLGQTILPPNKYNPKGYWEHSGIVALHDRLLEALKSCWDDIYPLPENWWKKKEVKPFNLKIFNTLKKDFSNSTLWGIKDPRICRLLPIWTRVFRKLNCNPCFIIISRHPYEVAESLAKRDGFNKQKSYLLWLEHMIEAEKWTREYPRVFVSYDSLLNDWQSVFEKIASGFSLTWPNDPSEVSDEMARFLLPLLKHHRKPFKNIQKRTCVYLWAESLYEAIKEAGFSKGKLKRISEISKEFEGFKELAKPILIAGKSQEVKLSDWGKNLDQEIKKKDNRIKELQNEVVEISNWGKSLDNEVERLSATLKQQKKIISSLNKSLQSTDIESIRPSGLIEYDDIYDESVYLETNPDVVDAVNSDQFVSGYEHWIKHGLTEYKAGLRRPGFMNYDDIFDEKAYLEANSDVAEAVNKGEFISGYAHWVKHGVSEYKECLRIPGFREGKNSHNNTVSFQADKDEINKLLRISKKEYTSIKKAELDEFLQSNGVLKIPISKNRKISIIIVLYNRAELTFACLKSVIENTNEAIKVIIVDNASTDKTKILLDNVVGAKVITNTKNQGFAKACNQAARLAKGEFLLFLNYDTLVKPNSIKAALNAFEKSKDTGAVGGKILLLDGTLQEAGSIVWSDGSCLGYGRGDSPFAPEYMFQRDVDYCSGAFLLTSRKLFKELNGFDENFNPAYYEDADYCLRLRKKGHRIVYEPNAVISHFEFAGSSNSKKAIEMQTKSRRKFLKKHQKLLASQFNPDLKNILKARFASTTKYKAILYIDDRVPHFYHGSGCPRANCIINGLVKMGYRVTFYPLNFPDEDQWDSAYSDIQPEIEIILGYGRNKLAEFIKNRMGYYDLIFISRPHNMAFFNKAVQSIPDVISNMKIIYDAEAIFSLRDKAEKEVKGTSISSKAFKKMTREELRIADKADLVTAITERERKVFVENGYKNVFVLGHELPVRPTKNKFNQRKDILFVGNLDHDQSPNVDSLIWFVHEVFPLILKEINGVQLKAVGSCKSKKLQRLKGKNIKLFGRVKDTDNFYDSCRIFVAPTRYSAGMPIKLLEAAARGIPSVATTLLVEQLGWKDNKEIIAADFSDPVSFAKHCTNLYKDRTKWEFIRHNALQRISLECSSETFINRLRGIISSLIPLTTNLDSHY